MKKDIEEITNKNDKETEKVTEMVKKVVKVELGFGQAFRFGVGFGAGLLFLFFILSILVVSLDYLLLETLFF